MTARRYYLRPSVCLSIQVYDMKGETNFAIESIWHLLSGPTVLRQIWSCVGDANDLVAATYTGTPTSSSPEHVAKHIDLLAQTNGVLSGTAYC